MIKFQMFPIDIRKKGPYFSPTNNFFCRYVIRLRKFLSIPRQLRIFHEWYLILLSLYCTVCVEISFVFLSFKRLNQGITLKGFDGKPSFHFWDKSFFKINIFLYTNSFNLLNFMFGLFSMLISEIGLYFSCFFCHFLACGSRLYQFHITQ